MKKIEDALPPNVEFESAGVRYLEREFLLIDDVNFNKYRDLALRPYLAKGVEFEHEHEVRIITRCETGEERISVNTAGIVQAIDQVIITPLLDMNSTRAMRTELQRICSAKIGIGAASKVRYSSINSRLLLETEAEQEFDEIAGSIRKRLDGFPLQFESETGFARIAPYPARLEDSHQGRDGPGELNTLALTCNWPWFEIARRGRA